MAVGLAFGPLIGFGLAFDSGTCNPNFSDVNFVLLITLGTMTSFGVAYCAWRAATWAP